MRINLLIGGMLIGYLSATCCATSLSDSIIPPEPKLHKLPRRGAYHPPAPYAMPRIASLIHRCIRPLRIGSVVARMRWKRRRFVQALRAAT